MQNLTVVNIRLPKEIVQVVDTMVQNKVFQSRSEAIRQFTREYVIRNRE